MTSIFISVVKSVNSEKPISSRLIREVKTSGWVCKSRSVLLLLVIFEFWACDYKFLTLCFHSQLLLGVGAQFCFGGGRCSRWVSEILRKPQFPLRRADCLYTDVYLRAWRHGQTAFSQTVRLQHSCWQQMCHSVGHFSGSSGLLHLQFSFRKDIFL